jgi:predicted nucleotidyltransferase
MTTMKTIDAASVMPAPAAAVAGAVLDEEGGRRRHLVVSLSGAHAYGFPSVDSDLDLKAVHVEPAARLLGLRPPVLHASRLEVISGVEIDYSSNEVGPVLVGILNGNGNYIERLLGPLCLRSSVEHAGLAPLVVRSLSRRAHRHYHGFASGQLRDLQAAPAPTAKKVLYVLRTALTGLHLLTTGEVVTDLGELVQRHPELGLADAHGLIATKRSGERITLQVEERDRWVTRAGALLEALDAAQSTSPLPEESPNAAELEGFLLDLRRRSL